MRRVVSEQFGNGLVYEMVDHETLKSQKPKASNGKMSGTLLEIGLASAALTMPMFILTVVLLALVFGHQMPNHSSTYSYNNETELSLGSAYYVDYSATTLVYIASLSSTLSTILISAAMILFSYSLARSIAQNSDGNDASELPSPFQLQLLVRMVDGRLAALWSYLLYVFGRKHRKVTIIPVLRQAVAMLSAFLLLAGLITLADLWLHLSTKPVEYLEMRPQPAPDWFKPGRGVKQSCLDYGRGEDPSQTDDLGGCLFYPGDVIDQPVLINQTEYAKTVWNLSDMNQVYMGFHEGLQYSALGPARVPDNLDFQATSYGSHTECHMVTTECGAESAYGDRGDEELSVFNFACNNTMAGLNMTGNFAYLGKDVESYDTSGQNASMGYSQAPTNPRLPKNASMVIIEDVNTMSENNFALGFQYFNDSAMLQQVRNGVLGLGSAEYGPITNTTNQYFWALAFHLDFLLNSNDSAENRNPWSNLNMVADAQGGVEGIMSCKTDISEITYSMSQPALTILSASSPRPNASIPFIDGITGSWGDEQLLQGLQKSFISAKTPEDFTSLFATVYDRTLVAIPAGVLNALPVINATQRVQTQVTRVPRAPFMCLLLLNLLYAGLGIVLTVTALVAVGLGKLETGQDAKGTGIRDAQARLSVAAIVAESFEAPNLGDDARSVDDLFAERRGRVTRRVALGMGPGGGRRFRQVVVPEEIKKEESVGLVSSRG